MFPVQRGATSTLTFNTTLPLASANYSDCVLINDRTGAETFFRTFSKPNLST